MTNVPSPVFGPLGFISPFESAVLAGVQADIDAAFGGGVNPALEAPQGQLASSLTAIIGDKNDKFALMVNQVDPAFSAGRMQDGIARIYFLDRIPAQPTSTQCLCSGLVNVPIPTGTLALASDGNLYSCTAGGVIGAAGNVTLPFACLTGGPIACPAGSVNELYTQISGWDHITNVADGVIGRLVENRYDFERRRAASVAINAIGIIAAVRALVLTVPGVTDAYATENELSTPQIIGGYTLLPNSICVTAAGGDPQAVANAIWTKKPPGSNYNGNTSVVVFDSNSGYQQPVPSYLVKFITPTPLTVFFMVTMANNSGVPSNATQLIQDTILKSFSGADGGSRAQIGATIYASRYYCAIAALGPWAEIISIQLGVGAQAAFSISDAIITDVLAVTPPVAATTTASTSGNLLTVNIDQVPVTSAADITVVLQ